jgi:iron complex outermembrane receptor protein
LPFSPRYKFTFSGDYSHQVNHAWPVSSALMRCEIARGLSIDHPAADSFAPHWTVGGRLGLKTADDRYPVGLCPQHVQRSRAAAALYRFPAAGSNGAIYGPNSTRQVGLSLDAKF